MRYYLCIVLFFFIIDIILYRNFKKNFFIDNIKISFSLFLVLSFINFEYFEENVLKTILFIFNYILILIAYFLLFLGIKKTSPSLFILSQLKQKKISYKKLKKKFLTKDFFNKRLNDNLKSNLNYVHASKISIKKKGIIILNLFNFLKLLLKI
jgi:hypothetical protein